MEPGSVLAFLRLSAAARDDWSSALQEFLRIDSDLLAVDRVSFWTIHDAPAWLYCELAYIASSRAFERGATVGRSARPRYLDELRTLELITIDDVRRDSRVADMQGYFDRMAIGGLLDVPLYVGGRVEGVLCHEHVGQARPWSSREQELAIAAGQTLVAMLEARARGHHRVAEERAVFLSDVVPTLTEAATVDEVAQRATDHAIPMLGEMAVLLAFEKGELRHRAVAHITPQGRDLLDELYRQTPPTLETLRTDPTRTHPVPLSIFVPDATPERVAKMAGRPALVDFVRRLEIQSLIAAPLLFRGEMTGWMIFASKQQIYRRDDLLFAEAYARQIAGIFENARLYDRAQKALGARDEFLSLASHELRTPLTSLRAAVRALGAKWKASLSSTRGPSLVEIIERQVERLDRLNERMLDAGRITEGIVLRRERLDLTELVHEVISTMLELERDRARVSVNAEGPVMGDWDRRRLEQVISNVIENALKFGDGKPIDVSVQSRHERAVLLVRDRGIGIATAECQHVFERFHRGVSSRNFGGLGLGLYIAHAIVEAHSGALTVESGSDGKGTTVTVELPSTFPSS